MFDLLRAKVEAEVSHPAVVVITSATNLDCRAIAAQALATSLATTGYSTLLIDASSETDHAPCPVEGFSLDQIGCPELVAASTSKLTVVALGESVQRSANQRNINTAFELLRERFDYVIISAGYPGSSSAFAATVLGAANAVLVSVKIGRRQTRGDARLAADLKRLGPRFLGLIPTLKSTTNVEGATHSLKAAETTESGHVPPPVLKETIEIDRRARHTISKAANAMLSSMKMRGWPRFLDLIPLPQSRKDIPTTTSSLIAPDISVTWHAPVEAAFKKTFGEREKTGWPRYAFLGGSVSVVLLAWLLVEVSSK